MGWGAGFLRRLGIMTAPTKAPSPRSPSPSGPRSGFSLIEMLIVVIMIGILAGMAVSRLDWNRYRADSVARGLMADISTAQRTAVSLQSDVRVTVLDNRRLRIHEDLDNDGAIDGGERVTYSPLEYNFVIGKGSASNVPSPADPTDLATVTLVFRRDGTASRSGTYYIRSGLPDADCKYCRAIAVARATGRTVWYSRATGAWVRGN
jgi:prepilin-type N-terminal cleavage/methylation domain-containing protein